MGDRDDAWHRVAERFRSLGQRFKEHYEDTGEPATEGTNEDVKRALQDLGEALDRVFTATGNALRDESVRDEGKRAATALGDALGVTFAELGEDLRRVVGKRQGDLEAGFAGETEVAPGDEEAQD
jgi:hypothetical protein